MDAIRRVDFDDKGPHRGEQCQVPNELPIHGEIYKQRPAVGCVIHAHPTEALICGITELEFRPIFGAFNIPEFAAWPSMASSCFRAPSGDSTRTRCPMIAVMGDKLICLMKGHGITVVGATVDKATMRALNFNRLTKAMLQVAQTGRAAAYISSEDIEKLPDLGSTFNHTWLWRYYARKLKAEDAHLDDPGE